MLLWILPRTSAYSLSVSCLLACTANQMQIHSPQRALRLMQKWTLLLPPSSGPLLLAFELQGRLGTHISDYFRYQILSRIGSLPLLPGCSSCSCSLECNAHPAHCSTEESRSKSWLLGACPRTFSSFALYFIFSSICRCCSFLSFLHLLPHNSSRSACEFPSLAPPSFGINWLGPLSLNSTSLSLCNYCWERLQGLVLLESEMSLEWIYVGLG